MTKNLQMKSFSKAFFWLALPLLCWVAAVPAHAQSAEIRSAGVYYIDTNTTISPITANQTGTVSSITTAKYCGWTAQQISEAEKYDVSGTYGSTVNKSAITNVANMNTDDPWQTSALIEYDQPYPSLNDANQYPNHCLALCFDVYCTNKPNGATTYSITFPLQQARFEIAQYQNSKDIMNPDTSPAVRTIDLSILDNAILNEDDNDLGVVATDLSNYMCAGYACYGTAADFTDTQTCPNPEYECALKSEVIANGLNEGACTEAADNSYCCRELNSTDPKFPYVALVTPNNDSESSWTAFWRSIGEWISGKNYSPQGKINDTTIDCGFRTKCSVMGVAEGLCQAMGGAANGRETPCIVRSTSAGKGYNDPVRFCTGWDGSREIQGEFGKINGQFGFRANVQTKYNGDGIAVQNIEVDDTFVYPSKNQYPIQVDVTNVHTVRTTPTVMGAITPVESVPYNFAYRLSKDAEVSMGIYETSGSEVTSAGACANWLPEVTLESECADDYNGSLHDNCGVSQCCADADWDASGVTICSTSEDTSLILKRNLIDWQPRLGEGFLGSDKDVPVVESESWDGRDDNGRLLPANNYLMIVQARTRDEWPGVDLSRRVIRQVSLDPLKLTDIVTQGLSKQSTAYATIKYVPTQASKVYFNVYSPGTTFASEYTTASEATGTGPAINPASNGVLVFSSSQERGGSAIYTDKWDGLCHNADGCAIKYPAGTVNPLDGTVMDGTEDPITYANGAPLPDGNYVYVLWAEIPYNDPYTDAAGNVYTAVKTLRYYTGMLPVERGLVDITIQPVSYSTIGSSPTAYGLDPFIFKYSVAREAVVNAYVKNTAGVIVKTLTNAGGNTAVAQQMNTLIWDGLDDNGRMVGPGTYLFTVEAADPMFPLSIKSYASAQFPVDVYRITNVSTTDVYGDSGAKATISYMLSKAMNVQINIYNKDVVIPVYTDTTGTPTVETQTAIPAEVISDADAMALLPDLTTGYTLGDTIDTTYVANDVVGAAYYVYTTPVATGNTYTYYRLLKQVTAADADPAVNTESYTVTEVLQYTVTNVPWPPRVCDTQTDGKYFCSTALDNTGACPGGDNEVGYVNPATNPQCIYVNDTTFTAYPTNPNAAKYNYAEGAKQTLHVRLQPVKTFDRSALRTGDGLKLTEEWDAQYFYNPTPVSVAAGGKNTVEAVAACAASATGPNTDKTACPYEMVPDGTYPFYVAASTNEAMDIYYDSTTGVPLRAGKVHQTGWYATEKPVSRINITRGPVYFLDGSVSVYPNAPQLFNTSSGPVLVPPYEINFSISRAATVEVAIVGLKDNMCTITQSTGTAYSPANWTYNKAGQVCKYLSTMTIPNTGNFDPNLVRRIYWDGTDNNGRYVKNGNYEIRLIAKNYPDEGLYQPTVKQLTQNIDLLKVFDLPDAEAYAINTRGTDMNISYQLSVPMKVGIQIFKPGTTIYDYTKGTLRDPATGEEVKDINDVLVKSIVGIRPSTTLIEELWDGTDYANQEVPDGTYPFRFVTALNSADIDSLTGEIVGVDVDDSSTNEADWKISRVADTYQYVNLHHATVAIGDGQFVCEDWEKTVFFYPNPFKTTNGTMEITKLPVPGTLSIKLYNLAGDLVREGGYSCVDAQNLRVDMGNNLYVQPDNNPEGAYAMTPEWRAAHPNVRNAALRCFWDRTNDHGKRVARGVYFGLVDFRAKSGRQHCQKVVKILIPK